MSSSQEEMLLKVLSLGYAVQFEGSAVGDYFVLLRDLEGQQVVYCCTGNTPAQALEGAAAFAMEAQGA